MFSNLYQNGLLERNVFSLCLGSSSGELFLGGYDPNLDAGPIQYVPMLAPFDFYRVPFQTIQIGRSSSLLNVGLLSDSTFIDSGTTSIELSIDAWRGFVSTYQTQYPDLPHISDGATFFSGMCFSKVDIDAYPTLTFSLSSDVELSIPPAQYLVPGTIAVTGGPCHSMVISSSGSSTTVLGAAFMTGFNVIFDLEESRIGFAGIQNCGENPFISSILNDQEITAQVGANFTLQVSVHYLISHRPVVGLIVEFHTTRGSTKSLLIGKATDGRGIATLENVLLTNATATIIAIVPGSISPKEDLQFTVRGEGELPPGFGDSSPFYSVWRAENISAYSREMGGTD